jgi:hypothetical protein
MHTKEIDKGNMVERELRRFRIALEVIERHPDILAEFKERALAL